MNLWFTFMATLLYIAAMMLIPQLAPYKKLLAIGVTQLIFGTFSIEWLFRGIEDFKYITLRTLSVRFACMLSIFLFVRDSKDYIFYFSIYSGMVVLNGIINWNYRRKFVKYSFQSFRSILNHIKPCLYLGSQNILQSVYTTFNVVYLGMVCGDIQVGLYTTAIKIEGIILALYTSVTLVLMPRISAMMENDNKEGVERLTNRSFSLLFAFVFPCLAFTECFTEGIVSIVAGSGYEGAVLLMRVVMPAMLVVGLEQILIVQILMPSGADKQVLLNCVFGAACSVLLNLLFVSRLQGLGTSFIWVISEIAVMSSALYFVKKNYPLQLSLAKNTLSHSIAFLPLIAILFLMKYLPLAYWTLFVMGFGVTLLYSHFSLKYMVKNPSYIEILT